MPHATLRVLAVLLGTVLVTALASGGALPGASAAGGRVPAAEGTSTDYGRMMLVLDSSGSMKESAGGGTTKIAAAKQALGTVVDELPAQADVGLRVFGAKVFSKSQRGACTDSQLVVEPGTGNRGALRSAVASYKPYGETPIAYALQQAAQDIGNEGARSIVLVSDGIATCQPDPCDVAGQLAKQGIDLQIDVVGLSVSGQARQQLQCIADRGNGSYYDADSADDISSSLIKVANRAVRPFEYDGQPITGGATSAQATKITAGVWQDTLGVEGSPDFRRWYRYDRKYRGSTVYVGMGVLSNERTDASTISAVTESGKTCDVDANGAVGARNELYGIGVDVGAGTEDPDPEDPCQTGPLLIKVEHQAGTFSETRSRFSLRVVEEPAVTNKTALPAEMSYDDPTYRAPSVTGSPKAVTGGQSLGDATTLTDGTYSANIVPGESQVYRVKLDWGQALSAQVTTQESTPELDQAGVNDLYGNLQVLNPLGVNTPDDPQGSEDFFQYAASSGPDQGTIASLPVRWKNRDSTSFSYLDGWYYLVVNADPDRDNDSAELPYTLKVQVQGDRSGVPEYAKGEQVLDQQMVDGKRTGGGSDSGSGSGGAGSGASGDGSGGGLSTPLKLVSAGGLGIVAIGCLVGALLLLRPRRT